MKRKSQGLRRTEFALWLIGVALLGVALAATAERWTYQTEQEEALSVAVLPDRSVAGELPPRRDSAPVQGPAEWFGPVPAPNSVPRVTLHETPAPVAAEKIAEKPAPKPHKPREIAIDPATVGRIEIPRLGMRAIIRRGSDDDTLDRAVGLLPGAAAPGEQGNVVLAAHRDTFFRPLRKIRVADRIKVVVPPNEYVYEVESTRVVTPQETSVLQSRGLEELTLVTCYPFGFLGPAPDRFIVSAKRVQ